LLCNFVLASPSLPHFLSLTNHQASRRKLGFLSPATVCWAYYPCSWFSFGERNPRSNPSNALGTVYYSGAADTIHRIQGDRQRLRSRVINEFLIVCSCPVLDVHHSRIPAPPVRCSYARWAFRCSAALWRVHVDRFAPSSNFEGVKSSARRDISWGVRTNTVVISLIYNTALRDEERHKFLYSTAVLYSSTVPYIQRTVYGRLHPWGRCL